LFPGYLFAHIAPESDDLLRIRSAPGVSYVLPRIGPPALLSEALIDAVRTREVELSQSAPGATFVRGDRVTVLTGPFRWVEAVFDRRLSASGRVRILLNVVHGSVAVQTDAANLEAVSRHPRATPRRWQNVA
jgi:transcriptional antiterminator RfaH